MSAPATMHPSDPFHVILDALDIVGRLSDADWERLNSGRPAWEWYDDLGDGSDPKTSRDGWMAVRDEAVKVATRLLEAS